jgi:hypothetical protein
MEESRQGAAAWRLSGSADNRYGDLDEAGRIFLRIDGAPRPKIARAMAIFGVPSRAGGTHGVEVGSVGAFAAKESAPQASEPFAKVTPEHFGKLTPHVRSRLSRACVGTNRHGCAAHSYGTVAVLCDVFLHTKPPPRGKSPVAVPQKECGARHTRRCMQIRSSIRRFKLHAICDTVHEWTETFWAICQSLFVSLGTGPSRPLRPSSA